MVCISGPLIIDDGLVLHLDAANTRSYPGTGTAWKDLSVNGNTGTLVNGISYANSSSGIMSFDRVDDYVNIPNSTSMQITGDLTISVWFKPTNYAIGRQGLIGRNGLNEYTITLEPSGAISLYFASSNQAGSYYNGASSSAFGQVNGIFQLLTIVRSFTSGFCYIYKNGVQTDVRSLSGVNQPTATSGPMTIGNGNGGLYFGSIGNLYLYNKSLSAVEIKRNFQATRGRYGI